MGIERAPLGFSDELENFDPTAWSKPDGKSEAKPKASETKRAAEAAGFRSREPVAPETVVEAAPKQRRRRTGRNVQFNIKTRAETIEEFCRIADDRGMGLGETFEFATALLAQHHATKS